MVLGVLFGYNSKTDYDGKYKMYKIGQEFISRFDKANGSHVCFELLCKNSGKVTVTASKSGYVSSKVNINVKNEYKLNFTLTTI